MALGLQSKSQDWTRDHSSHHMRCLGFRVRVRIGGLGFTGLGVWQVLFPGWQVQDARFLRTRALVDESMYEIVMEYTDGSVHGQAC